MTVSSTSSARQAKQLVGKPFDWTLVKSSKIELEPVNAVTGFIERQKLKENDEISAKWVAVETEYFNSCG